MTISIDMVTIDTADAHRLADFWTKALGTSIEHDWGAFLVLAPATEGGLYLGLQEVSDPTPGKNRLHFDTATADRAAEVARLVALGATEIAEHAVADISWTVLADPDGNQFCVRQTN